MRAAKAACGGDEAFYADILLDWAMGYTLNTPEAIRAKWDSHTESTIGAIWLYAKAREEFGWQETPEAFDAVEEPESEEAAMLRKRHAAPLIRIQPGDLDLTMRAAEKALVHAEDGIYCYGSRLVRPAKAEIIAADNKRDIGTRLVELRVHHLMERLTYAARFEKFDLRTKKFVNLDCPKIIAEALLEHEAWTFPLLTGFTDLPCTSPGRYDPFQPGI